MHTRARDTDFRDPTFLLTRNLEKKKKPKTNYLKPERNSKAKTWTTNSAQHLQNSQTN